MHLFDQKILGIGILFLLGGLVVVKRLATGSIFDKPQGTLLLRLVNIFNLFFLLVVNPLAAILLITRRFEQIDPTRLTIGTPWILLVLEIMGAAVFVLGFFIMAWALLILNRNYQLGGSAPRSKDCLVTEGPFKMVRNPMYTGALGISLGLFCLIQSAAILAVFFIYLTLILPLISLEEIGLLKAYGERYAAYRQKVKKLVPFIF